MSQDFVPLDCDWFEEPKDFRPPSPKPTKTEFVRECNSQVIQLNLPPKHSLWGHWVGGSWDSTLSLT